MQPKTMDTINNEDESTIPSLDSDNNASCKKNDDMVTSIHVIGQVAAISSMNTVFYLQILLLVLNYLPALKKRKGTRRKREANVRLERTTVIQFVRSWDDDMFKRQFRLSCEEFYELEGAILSSKLCQGYDLEQHYKYARLSSGSPISIELQLFITLRLLSGASYSLMQLSENWARKRRERHGFATNLGTVLAVDGHVVEIKKSTAADLDGQEVSCYQKWNGFWGLITQVGCDCNGRGPLCSNGLARSYQ
jgi:hypothetical protein